jgi:hypothetical protein
MTNTQPSPTTAPETGEPAPRVTYVRFMTTSRRKPRAGDRRVTKKHGLQIRIHVRARDFSGQPIGLMMRSGRPVFEWCEPKYLPSWDHHHLTADELARYFPPEQKPGYMQRRGAA